MVELRGVDVDPQTRCAHWRGPTDVIAIRFPCCDTYYPCFDCHRELAGHDAMRWPRARFDERAVLCGACRSELSISDYLGCGFACPRCGAAFNPGCANHYPRYFET